MSWQARIVAVLLACAACIGLGWRLGIDHMKAAAADANEVRQQTRADAAEGAASAIASIEIKQVTIKQATQTLVREVPVYRDCRHDKRVLDNINAALTGMHPGGSGMPAASAPD